MDAVVKNAALTNTSKFSVFDAVKFDACHQARQHKEKDNHRTRLTKSDGKLINDLDKNKVTLNFRLSPNPAFLQDRLQFFERAWALQKKRHDKKPREKITITLPDGNIKEGISWVTTPMDIAEGISRQLAKQIIVAEISYSTKIEDDEINVCCADGLELDGSASVDATNIELWDMNRPLIGNCRLKLLKWEDRDARAVFWHSSAHYLGYAMECQYGCFLTHGPPIEQGFFYDCFMGEAAVSEKDFDVINGHVINSCKKNDSFQRLMISKADALEMFNYNPFKIQFIESKVPDGGYTTVYKNGDFIDLCRGPHVPNSSMIQSFSAIKNSATYWLGKSENNTLQRIYGISFPDKKQLKKWQEFQEEAKKRDHRRIGLQQELFFFHHLSPGSAFFLPHGTRIYNRLIDFIRKEYRNRGYEEVTTPNIYNMELWNTSGHALHYKENMFRFDVEGHEYGMKPMNCPGHCLLFASRQRSYRELPLRIAEFGVLHRNEISGSLSGLTRVRRFCQDDAHIFCREDQITQEVTNSLHFMKKIYDIFGMTYKLELSTKPAKALGSSETWLNAENALRASLNGFVGDGNWKVNPGDGAFYGPKIDIKVFDAMERIHQCATIQLDFQLPSRFDLRYRGEQREDATESNDISKENSTNTVNRPVMVHRAMLGSLERMIAVLTEHYGGRWPFWLSPRQIMVVPVGQMFVAYGQRVQQRLFSEGFYVDVDETTKTMNKKIREAETAHYNYILVVGAVEEERDEVNCREAGNKMVQARNMKVSEIIGMLKNINEQFL